MKKRLLALALALIMTLGLFSVSALADGTVTPPEPTYDWYTGVTEGTEYTISSLSDYLGFVKLTNGAAEIGGTATTDYFSGKTVKLACDLDFDGIDFLYCNAEGAITSNWRVYRFDGTFDGQDHTMKNVTYTDNCTSGSCMMAIFRNVYGTIKNLNVENVTATANTALSFGGIVGYMYKASNVTTGIYNCTVKDVAVTVNAQNVASVNSVVGGLAGFIHDNKEIKNCSVTNFTVNANNVAHYMGGLVGWFYIGAASPRKGEVSNCHVKNFTANVAGLTGRFSGGGGADFGGIGGMLGYGHDGNSNYAFPITGCTVDGINITVGKAYNQSFVGGFIGMSRRRYAVSNCTVKSGSITVGSADETMLVYVGGFCGAPTGVVIGDTSGWSQDANGAAVSFEDCKVEGVDVIVSGSCVAGGFAGIVGACFSENSSVTKNSASFKNCTVSGVVYAEKEAGGFAGKVNHSSTFDETCSAEKVMVTAASENTKSNDKVNDEKIGAAVITGADKIKPAAVVQAPEGETITAANGVIELPAGTTVTTNGATTTLTNGGKIEDDVLVRYASAVTLDQGSLSLSVGETAGLTATTDPAGSFVEWSSTAPSVATVDANGRVTAVSGGAATITATSGAASASCTVTVQNSSASVPVYTVPTYPVTLSTGAHGTVMASATRASSGSAVVLTVEPKTGYKLDSLTVVDENGRSVAVTRREDGRYSFVMPDCAVSVTTRFLAENWLNPFTDISAADWYYDAVSWACQSGVATGTSATSFSPNDSCTRAQLVTLLWRAAGEPEPASKVNPFGDVAYNSYYKKAVLWAVEQGITTGTSATTFSPEETCTRAEAVTFLFRYAAANGMDAVTLQELVSGFGDAAGVPGYSLSAFNWALASKLVQGAGGRLLPNDSCTRAQIVTMLYRFFG